MQEVVQIFPNLLIFLLKCTLSHTGIHKQGYLFVPTTYVLQIGCYVCPKSLICKQCETL
jgi:hypothetical protein